MPTFCIVVSHDPKMEDYTKDVLEKAGCNTFPEYLGTCQCNAKVRSNIQQVNCPACGKPVTLKLDESFSNWSFHHNP
jgi:hypothetical protein